MLPGPICIIALQATAELYDEEGFIKTGDVCEQLGPDEFAWIDRVSNIIKMSQGEYVSVSRLEAIYAANSPSIHQMFLYGNSLRAYLVAIVVPNQGESHSCTRKASTYSRLGRSHRAGGHMIKYLEHSGTGSLLKGSRS